MYRSVSAWLGSYTCRAKFLAAAAECDAMIILSDKANAGMFDAAKNLKLDVLPLDGNKVSDEGAKALGKALEAKILTVLSLCSNKPPMRAPRHLGKALESNTLHPVPGRQQGVAGVLARQGVRGGPRLRGRRTQDRHDLGLRQAPLQRCSLRVPWHVAYAIGFSRGEAAHPIHAWSPRCVADQEWTDAW